MKEIISNNLSRLGLHDSSVEKIIYVGSDLVIMFDWCKLNDYEEKGFNDVIIVGRSSLLVENYRSDILKLDFGGTPGHNDRLPEFIAFDKFRNVPDFLISRNMVDDNLKVAKIEGLWKLDDIYCWLEWSFDYNYLTLEWDDFITREEWKQGKIL